MGTMIKLKCCNPDCGKEFEKPIGEVNRKLKNGCTEFYCSIKCSGIKNKKRIKPMVKKICPVCGNLFETKSGAKEATFCSRSCDSKGSITEARKRAGKLMSEKNFKNDTYGIEHIQKLLKEREKWKYEKIDKFLNFLKEKYEFECLIGDYIYDLAFIEKKIIVEFDGPEHQYTDESKKDENAIKNGWQIFRLKVEPNCVIEPDVLYKILEE